MDTAVLMEIEDLRRASLARLQERFREVFQEETRSRHREHLFRRIAWRLQALAEGDLTERARVRANEIARDADLRVVAPRDFFTVGDEQIQTMRRDGNRDQDSRLPLPGILLSRKWKGRTILVESSQRDSGMRIDITLRSARLPLRLPVHDGTGWRSSGLRAP